MPITPPQPSQEYNLADPDVFRQLKDYIESTVITFDELQEAYLFARGVEGYRVKHPDFEREHPDIVREYERLVALAKWIACIRIRDEEVVQLFERHFVEAFRHPDIDVPDKLIAHLIVLPPQDRDDFKEKVRAALLANTERLTSEFLEDASRARHDPTVGNWLKDYHSIYGTGAHNAVTQIEYVEHSRNAAKLSQEERELLRRLIHFFEELKISSLTPAGMEESPSVAIRGKQKILRKGRLETVELSKEQENLLRAAQKIIYEIRARRAREVFPLLEKDYRAFSQRVEAFINDVSEGYGYDLKLLALEMVNSDFELVPDRAVACALVLARKDAFFEVFVRPGYWYNKVKRILVDKRFPSPVQKDFEEMLFAPPYLNLLFREIFQKLPEEESAMAGTMIATEMEKHGHKEYAGMAYADLKQQRFVWGDVAVIEGRLQLVPADVPEEARGLSEQNQTAERLTDEELLKIREAAPPSSPTQPPLVP